MTHAKLELLDRPTVERLLDQGRLDDTCADLLYAANIAYRDHFENESDMTFTLATLLQYYEEAGVPAVYITELVGLARACAMLGYQAGREGREHEPANAGTG